MSYSEEINSSIDAIMNEACKKIKQILSNRIESAIDLNRIKGTIGDLNYTLGTAEDTIADVRTYVEELEEIFEE